MAELLVVQQLDTHVQQLLHRRETLEQRTLLVAAHEDLGILEAQLTEIATSLKALRSSQKEAEDHAALVEDKSVEVNSALYDGSVTSHKELEVLQSEHRMLKEQQSKFEDRALELMEQAEPVESELSTASNTVADTVTKISDLEAQITVAEAELDAQIEGLRAERDNAAEPVSDELLGLYAALSARSGGVAVAELTGARCGGCHLEIPSAELEQVRRAPDDAAVQCPECGCLLVR